MSGYFKGLYYRCAGKSSKGPVLFLHGFMGNCGDWNEVINNISDDYYCIAVDLPGHGQSNHPDVIKTFPDFDVLSSVILELLSFLNIEEINLVGYSLGGRVAQHIALKSPLRIKKLILESSSFGIKDINERHTRFAADKMLSTRLKKENFEDFLDQWYSQSVFSGFKDHLRYSEMFTKRLSNNPLLLSRALQAFSIGRQSFLQEKLSDSGITTLLICGARDSRYCDIMKNAELNNPGFKCVIMETCGHNTHFEEPNLFAEHIREFLSL